MSGVFQLFVGFDHGEALTSCVAFDGMLWYSVVVWRQLTAYIFIYASISFMGSCGSNYITQRLTS